MGLPYQALVIITETGTAGLIIFQNIFKNNIIVLALKRHKKKCQIF